MVEEAAVKLSNLSKNSRLSVVRANFGGSGAKRKLEAKRVDHKCCVLHFPFFTRSDLFVYLVCISLFTRSDLFVYLVCGTPADITLDINPGNEVIK